MAIRSYRDLAAWQVSMKLAESCYRFTEKFPKTEVFGLAAHIRKSAVSIPSNIAERHGRRSRAAYAAFVGVAMGSQAELETQIELARRLEYGEATQAVKLLETAGEVGRILNGLRLALANRPDSQAPRLRS
jgi:four helix bundle protein